MQMSIMNVFFILVRVSNSLLRNMSDFIVLPMKDDSDQSLGLGKI